MAHRLTSLAFQHLRVQDPYALSTIAVSSHLGVMRANTLQLYSISYGVDCAFVCHSVHRLARPVYASLSIVSAVVLPTWHPHLPPSMRTEKIPDLSAHRRRLTSQPFCVREKIGTPVFLSGMTPHPFRLHALFSHIRHTYRHYLPLRHPHASSNRGRLPHPPGPSN